MHSFSSSRIYLVGYMGSGKTSVGQLLADKLGYLFIDTDAAIESLHNQKIKDIFETEGEQAFREMEIQQLRFVQDLEQVVIATGGGLPMFENNMTKLLQSGTTIYIACTVDNLLTRLSESDNRPLHNAALDRDMQKQNIENRLNKRKATYEQAHLIVDGNETISKIIEKITAKLIGDY